jgi:hypothetical protein
MKGIRSIKARHRSTRWLSFGWLCGALFIIALFGPPQSWADPLLIDRDCPKLIIPNERHEELLSELSSPDWYERRKAAEKLGALGITEAIPLLMEHLNDVETLVSASAAIALGRLDARIAIPKLEAMAKLGQEGAATALGLLRSESSVPILEEVVARSNAWATQTYRALEQVSPGQYQFDEILADIRDEPMKVLAFSFNHIRYHTIYRDQIGNEEFFNQTGPVRIGEMKKDGGRNFVFGGPLLGSIMVRVVSQQAYRSWSAAFHAKDHWRAEGFRHLPIEPMLPREEVVREFHLASASVERLVEFENELKASWEKPDQYAIVYTRVLGPSLSAYIDVVDPDAESALRAESDRIEATLRRLDVIHGHKHPGNFCVQQINGRPELVMIDFDRARRPGEPDDIPPKEQEMVNRINEILGGLGLRLGDSSGN